MQTIAGALMHGAVGLLSRGLPRRLHLSIHTLLHLFFTSLVMACAVHLAKPVIEPFEVAMRSLVASVATGMVDPPSDEHLDLAVLRIDQHHFDDPKEGYGGRSPLDRGRLLADLKALLQAQPGLESIGFDLDLSPTVLGQPDADELALYRELGRLPIRFTLILPLEEQKQADFIEWFDAQFKDAPNVQLAHPEIVTSFGLATRLRADPRCPSLGIAMQQRAAAPAEGNRTCRTVQTGHCRGDTCRDLAYHHLARLRSTIEPLYADDRLLPLPRQIEALKARPLRTVLIGAAYGTDDVFETAVGPMYGVDVHAASMLGEPERYSHVADFIADLFIGMVFGWLVASFWRRYFRVAAGRSSRWPPELAWIPLAGLILLLSGLWILLSFVSVGLLTRFNLWFNPTAMMLGMLLDAFVVGSVHVAEHELSHGAPPRAPSAARVRGPVLQTMQWGLAQVPFALWLSVVIVSLHQLLSHH
jgi:hypothetical protein